MKLSVRSLFNLKTLTLVVVIVLPVLYRFTPLSEVVGGPQQARAFLDRHGLLNPVWFIPSTLPLILLGCPRLLICTLGGILHGFWMGTLLCQTSTLIGATAIFAVARRLNQRVPERVERVLTEYGFRSAKGGILAVFSVRQLPIPGFLMNIGLGSCRIRLRTFLLGSLLGFLPLGLPATAVGAGVLKADRAEAWGLIGIAGALLVAVAVGIRVWQYRRRLRAAVEPPAPPHRET